MKLILPDELLFLRLDTSNDQLHLLGVGDLPLAVVARNEFIEQHWPKLGVHDLLVDHTVNRFFDVPCVDLFIVHQAFEASRGLIKPCPDTVKNC